MFFDQLFTNLLSEYSSTSIDLSEKKINLFVQQIFQSVPELKQHYLNSHALEQRMIVQRVKDSYVYECKINNKILTVDEYIKDIEGSLGWDWVLSDKNTD